MNLKQLKNIQILILQYHFISVSCFAVFCQKPKELFLYKLFCRLVLIGQNCYNPF